MAFHTNRHRSVPLWLLAAAVALLLSQPDRGGQVRAEEPDDATASSGTRRDSFEVRPFRSSKGDPWTGLAIAYGPHRDGQWPGGLLRPDTAPIGLGSVSPPILVLEDVAVYEDGAPWPSEADGPGRSLAQAASDLAGTVATSWVAHDPSPGTTDFALAGDLDLDGDVDFDDIGDMLLAVHDAATYEARHGMSALLAADLDRDGRISDNDLETLARLLTGNRS